MNLTVQERLVALSILPREGDYATLKLLTQLKLALSFTEKEFKEWEIVGDVVSNRTNWKINGDAEIPIGEKATDIMVKALKKLNEDKKLPDIAMSLYEKFIPASE